MISHISEESIDTAAPAQEAESKQSSRPRKLGGRTFDFFRRRSSRDDGQVKKDDLVEVKIVECKLNNAPPTKMSFDFFRNIKRHMHIKSLTMCKSKQKAKEIEAANQSNGAGTDSMLQNEKSVASDQEICTDENKQNSPESSQVSCDRETSGTAETPLLNACISHGGTEVPEQRSNTEHNRTEANNARSTNKTETESELETIPAESPSCSNHETQASRDNVVGNTMAETDVGNREIPELRHNISNSVTNDSKVKASLAEELLKLSKYGWYWGPISGEEADAKLISEPDGAFLVRDSSDDRYVLTLSFKSSGKLLHARMEHSGGLFSLCNQSECNGFSSVAALINHSMNFSQSAVFCYSRPKYPGYPSFPVRLTKPVSRFTQVRSLQYLCRFVIRQNTRLDNIHKLPLPNTIKGYIEEAHY